jgi:ribokinase
VTDRFDVCVVGSANLDLIATTNRLPAPGETVLGTSYAEHAGGKGLNQAVAAARSGASTAFVGAVGRDDAAARLRSVLEHDGIEAGGVLTDRAPTGRALIVVDAAGENSIVVVPGANASVTAAQVRCSASVFLVQLEIPVSTVSAVLMSARAEGAMTVLNPAPARPLDPDLVALCDVIVPNEHEVDLLGGADALLAAGSRAVVTTRGAAGADIATIDGTRHVAAYDVAVVDTTGAGDAFCGALAARLAAGVALDDAVRWAAAAGALATTMPGAVPAQPVAAAIEALLAT